MTGEKSGLQNRPFAVLRQFVREKKNVERCELCSVELLGDHPHLVEPSSRQIVCSCDACAILFSSKEGAKFRRVPKRILNLTDFQMTEAEWEGLRIPINMAFFFYSTPAGKVVAQYPSPAGATESLLSLATWEEVVARNPVLKKIEADVEALLVYRIGQERETYIVPIDECYKLVGLIRMNWKGLSGGQEVWDEIKKFFSSLKDRSGVNRSEGLLA
jgi:Family of unknown function (DUF5947)